jgi:hypothetical protein
MGRLDAGLCFAQCNTAKDAWKQAKKGQPGRSWAGVKGVKSEETYVGD